MMDGLPPIVVTHRVDIDDVYDARVRRFILCTAFRTRVRSQALAA